MNLFADCFVFFSDVLPSPFSWDVVNLGGSNLSWHPATWGSVMYITSAYLEPGDLSIQASTFAGIAEKLDVRKMIDATKILQEMSQTLGEELKIADLPDWCSGVRELWLAETDHTDPCAALSEDFGRLRAKVIAWEAPKNFLRSFSRWQFSVAPNISRLEVLTDILEKTNLHLWKLIDAAKFLQWTYCSRSWWFGEFGWRVSYFAKSCEETRPSCR